MLKPLLYSLFLASAVTITVQGQEIMRQKSTTEGLSLSGFGQYGLWTTSSTDFKALSEKSAGGGLGIRLGYGLTQRLEPYLRADYAQLAVSGTNLLKTKLTHYDLGLRFNFGSTIRRFRPFVELAASRVHALIDPIPSGTDNFQLGLSGYGVSGGIGFNWFLSPAVAIHAEYASVLVGKFSKTVDLGYSGQQTIKQDLPGGGPVIGTGRFSAGVSYYFQGHR